MNAEIIAVGSELLTPQRVDTNSLYLTQELNDLGVEVTTKYVVGDDRERVADIIRRAIARSQFVVLSGGLGPTEDDVTRDALAQAVDRRSVFHQSISDDIDRRYRQLGRVMPEINKRQAYVVEGAEALPNDRGSAPGMWLDYQECSILLLPGPPHELKAMFQKQCRARIERRVPKQVIETLVLRTSGIGESDLDQIIAPVYTKYTNPVTTVLAHDGDIQVHLRARCATAPEALTLLAEVGGKIELLLGDRIYSRNGDSLEATIASMLRLRNAILAVAESATGGLVGHRVTGVPGSSDFFCGGFLAYTRQMKTALLGVPPGLIDEFGAVSKECAEAMANGARNRTGATYTLSVTGNAGPGTDGNQAPVGSMFIGLADAAGVISVNRIFPGDRERIRRFAAQAALDVLRRRMAGLL